MDSGGIEHAPPRNPQAASLEAAEESLRGYTWLCYWLEALSVLAYLPSLVALVLLYVRRGEAGRSTLYRSHFEWLIKTIWVTIGLGLFAIVLMATGVGAILGVLVLAGAFVWWVYRVIKGMVRLAGGHAVGVAG